MTKKKSTTNNQNTATATTEEVVVEAHVEPGYDLNVQEFHSVAGEGIKNAIDMPFDFSRTDRTWEDKYGITAVPLLVKSVNGEVYDDKRLKGVFINGEYKRIVGRNYTVLPNEEVEILLNEYIEKTNEGLSIYKRYQSHHGDARYWVVSSPERLTVESEDDVQLGCVVRNSIATYVALGADMWTFRLICENGAIAKGKDLGSIAIKHLGSHEDMMYAFGQGIETIIESTADLVKYYRQATKMTMNERIAQEWAKRIPKRALPTAIDIDPKTEKVSITSSNVNLWQAFNEITANSWHDFNRGKPMKNNAGFLTKNHMLQHAHKVLIAAVTGRYA